MFHDPGFSWIIATLMNAGSCRLHSIRLIDKLIDNCAIRKGKLNLLDFAGSERQNKLEPLVNVKI